ncbi:ABC transporter ATP-binding protein [Mesobacillus jeotgali]|uniref:ABC transporter ATP-binding protein n=1 Tax=Mesobacillus jeotgali TaxID=129985 RepID=UPI00177CE3F6|nr:ABC transporter ATP-binding protein [Mesobacillus jeotgali]UYZ24060.1 ABC transporter ATP-binding protein [Mesobacillus jeotgali]
MNQNVIEVKNVTRAYTTEVGIFKKEKKTVEALKGVSFSVKKGEIFGLLGPNGAGKTTMIKILSTMLIPHSGNVSILGLDPATDHRLLRPKINFILGGERNLYWRLSAYDNLSYFADLYKIPQSTKKDRIEDLLKLVGLHDVAHQKVETFSKGMKQRLQIARGLVNNPEILFLDEPSIGLDPVSARQLRETLRKLNNQGTTILLTTHYMYEADELCDRIAFINKGEIIDIDSPYNLKKKVDNMSIIDCSVLGASSSQIDSIKNHKSIQHIKVDRQDFAFTLRIQTTEPQLVVPFIYNSMKDSVITNLTISNPTLEDVYVRTIGENAS